MDKKTKVFNYLINLCFFLYFAVLLVERALSVVFSIQNGVALYGNVFNGYVYTLVFLSTGAFLVYLLLHCRPNIIGLFKPGKELSFKKLSIAGGILLLSGMVHTEYTIPALQFVSYGIWILAILFQVILNAPKTTTKGHLWLSFAYIVCYSMAIPVMYRTAINTHVAFHILEAIASIILVGVFVWFLLVIFGGGDYVLNIAPLVALIVFDVPILVMRWSEEANYFLLVALGLTLIVYIIDRIYRRQIKRKRIREEAMKAFAEAELAQQEASQKEAPKEETPEE